MNVRLPCGAWCFVDVQDIPFVKRAVVGKTLGASHVIVSSRWEEVVKAAVHAGTRHRENVRVRSMETVGYSSNTDHVLVERTFLSIPHPMRDQLSIAHSTASAHGVRNPRRLPSA